MTDNQVPADERDPGNSDPDDFTEPLDPDDDVFDIVLPDDQAPAGSDQQ